MDLKQLQNAYLTETNPQKLAAILATLQRLQGGSVLKPVSMDVPMGASAGSEPMMFPTTSAKEIVARANAERYGTDYNPLTMDPATWSQGSPALDTMSAVKARNDTPVNVPPPTDPLGGLGGAPQGPPQMVRIGSGSSRTVTHSPEFPAALLPQKRAIAAEAQTAAQDAAARKTALLDEQTAHAQLWTDQANLESRLAGKAAAGTYQRYEETGRELERGREQIRKSQLDPGRLWAQMPTAQKAVNAIGIALGGFVEGFTAGKVQNSALKMLNMAIDRDIAAQRDAFARQLEDLNLTSKAQSVLWQQWRAQEADRKAAALRVSQLEIAKMGLQSQREDVKTKAAETVLGIKDALVNTEAKTIPKTTKTSSYSSKTVPLASLVKNAPGTKTPPPALLDSAGQAVGVLQQLRGIQTKLKGYSLLGAKAPWNTESKRILESDIKPLTVELARLGGEKGPLSDGDIKRATEMIMGGWNTSAELSARLDLAAKKIASRTAAKLATAAPYFNVAPLAQQLRPYMGGAAPGGAASFGRPQ